MTPVDLLNERAQVIVESDDQIVVVGAAGPQGPPGEGEGGGGVTDHGDLTGLADDDHPQYHNDTRGDIRYYLKAAVDALVADEADARSDADDFLTTAVAGKQASDADLTAIAALDSSTAGAIASDGGGWIKKTYAQLKTALGLVKGDVGLGNVDNTADVDKPVSTAQAAADALAVPKSLYDANTILTADTDNTPAALTVAEQRLVGRITGGWIDDLTVAQVKTLLAYVKGDIGLGNVDNTADADKPVSTAQAAADATKVSKSTYDAHSLLKADTDDTPAALVVAEQRLVGRITGGEITDLTAAQVKTLLALAAGDLPTHGAAQHTDVARGFWVSGRPSAVTDGSSTGSKGTLPSSVPTLTFADAATQGAYFIFPMPEDAKAASPLTVVLFWTAGAADASAHSVVWSINALNLTAGSLVNAAGTTTQFTGASAARADAELVIEAETQVLASVSARELIRMDVRRLGADGSDNFTQTAAFLGALGLYTGVQ